MAARPLIRLAPGPTAREAGPRNEREDAMTANQDRLQELLDRQDILDCLTRVSRAVDRFDRDLWRSAYHEDAVIDAGQMVAPAFELGEAGIALHEAGQTATQHNLTNHSCEIDGDVAHAETYWIYGAQNRDGSVWTAGGRYLDRLERRDGVWKIAFRYTLSDWCTAGQSATPPIFEGVADIHANGAPARDRTDPSYQRPLVNRREVRMPEDARKLGDMKTELA
jgi:hypothetical protein